MKTHRTARWLAATLIIPLLAGCGGPAQPDAAPASSPSTAETFATGPQITHLKVRSAALKRKVSVDVILPGAASTAPAGGWPVLYLLHGSDGNQSDWLRVDRTLPDKAASSGVMIVMPDGGRAGYYSDWNRGARWERFHLTELPKYLRTHFPAKTTRSAIGGYSMGGFGALSYAARHPGRFKAVIGLSPVAGTLADPQVVLGDVRSAYGSSSQYRLWGNPSTATGRKTWKRHDPYYLASGLRKTWLYLYAGTGRAGDIESELNAQTQRLIGRLRSLGLAKLQLTLVARTGSYGVHDPYYWSQQLGAAWPGLTKALTGR